MRLRSDRLEVTDDLIVLQIVQQVDLGLNGLEVTGAEVQTRDDFERQQNASDADGDATTDAQDDFAEDAATAPRNRGYITAEGLDFWA